MLLTYEVSLKSNGDVWPFSETPRFTVIFPTYFEMKAEKTWNPDLNTFHFVDDATGLKWAQARAMEMITPAYFELMENRGHLINGPRDIQQLEFKLVGFGKRTCFVLPHESREPVEDLKAFCQQYDEVHRARTEMRWKLVELDRELEALKQGIAETVLKNEIQTPFLAGNKLWDVDEEDGEASIKAEVNSVI